MSEQKSDPYFKLKYMGYCMSQLPPDGVESTFEDFVQYAKFQLSLEKHVLMEDPIWNYYTDEQILVEYYALNFSKDKEERTRFETQMDGHDPDLNDWFEKKIAENRKEMGERVNEMEDSVSFSPESLGE